MSRKLHVYGSEQITVTFEPLRCLHAAECVRGLPAVFDPRRRPWVRLEDASAVDVAEVVARCPTGALTSVARDGRVEEPVPTANVVQVRPRGPLYLRGDLEISRPDGTTIRETRVALCRCGASKNKPWCDNSHQQVDFDDDGHLVASRLGSGSGQETALRLSLAANGPLLIDGPVEVRGLTGETHRGRKGALCRCGASAAKPYCDGAHAASGFEAE